jgi:hypothetical protein
MLRAFIYFVTSIFSQMTLLSAHFTAKVRHFKRTFHTICLLSVTQTCLRTKAVYKSGETAELLQRIKFTNK